METLQERPVEIHVDAAAKKHAKNSDTLLKTLSRNHYDLLRMVDSKATIILTVNSILLSFLGALHLAPEGRKELVGVYFSVLIYFCVASMIFALIGMLPHKYAGKRFEESDYQGSLYAGNFAERSLDEFRLEYRRITETGSTVFDEMTKDLYFLGCAIKRKQLLIRLSVGTLLAGLMLAGLYAYFQV